MLVEAAEVTLVSGRVGLKNYPILLLFLFVERAAQRNRVMLKQNVKQTGGSFLPETGKKIKNYIYNYNELVGKGNFAKVYRGQNIQTHDTVAVKIVSLDELKSKRLEELIYQEIKILQTLNHQNVLHFHEALLSQRNCYIITEMCNDGDLNQRLKKKKPFTEADIEGIILDLYYGLRYLKEMGVTHRDIKPANIFMHNGRAKIADFGLAKFYKENYKDLDIGSPPYMSPEGVLQNIYGQKTDLWSFGIVIFELLHGQSPFMYCTSHNELKAAVVYPIPQHKFRKNIPPLLRNLMNGLLEIDHTRRIGIHDLANDPYIRSLVVKEYTKNSGHKKFNLSENPVEFTNLNPFGQKMESKMSSQQISIAKLPQNSSKMSLQLPKSLSFNINKSMEIRSPMQKSLQTTKMRFVRQERTSSNPNCSSSFTSSNKKVNIVQSKPINPTLYKPAITVTFQSLSQKQSTPFLNQTDPSIRVPPRTYSNFHPQTPQTPQHSFQMEQSIWQQMSQHRQLSEKTAETNESEQERNLFGLISGRKLSSGMQFRKT